MTSAIFRPIFYYLGWASDKPYDRGHLDYKEFLAATEITFFRDNYKFLVQSAQRAQEAHDSGKRFVAIQVELNTPWVIREEDLPPNCNFLAPIEVQPDSVLPYARVRNWYPNPKTIYPPDLDWRLHLDLALFFQSVRKRLKEIHLSEDYKPLFIVPASHDELIEVILSNLQSAGLRTIADYLKDPEGAVKQEKLAAMQLAVCKPNEDLLNEIAQQLEKEK